MNNNYNEYISFFQKQDKKEKQSIIYEQLKMLNEFTKELCDNMNIKNNLIIDNKLIDLNDNYTENEYLECIVTLINLIQDSLCNYVDNVSELLSDSSQE